MNKVKTRNELLVAMIRKMVLLVTAMFLPFCHVAAQSWTAVNDGLTNKTVQVLTADPGNPGTLYTGTFRGEPSARKVMVRGRHFIRISLSK